MTRNEGTARQSIHFEPVTPGHYPMLRDWLRRPHWREWWGDPDTEFSYIRDMVEGRDTTRPFIFTLDGLAAGYIQYWFIGHHQNLEWIERHPWLGELPSDGIGVDLSIADAGQLSRGNGSRVLRTFATSLLEAGYRTIIIDPDPANARAVGCYRKAGFVEIAELIGRTDDTLLMRFRPDDTA